MYVVYDTLKSEKKRGTLGMMKNQKVLLFLGLLKQNHWKKESESRGTQEESRIDKKKYMGNRREIELVWKALTTEHRESLTNFIYFWAVTVKLPKIVVANCEKR